MDRTRILDRINRRGSPLVVLLAPAGYGKSDVAMAVAEAHGTFLKVECKSGSPFGADLATLLGAKSVDAVDVRTAWHGTVDTVLIVDSVECLDGRAAEIAALQPLLEPHPKNSRVIFCARRDPGIEFAANVEPHMLTILRREHLAFDEREMRALFESTGADDGLLYRLYAVTGGWPVPAMYCARVARSGDVEELLEGTLEHSFADLLEYIDANVFGNLPPPVLLGLCAVVGIPALRPKELDSLCGDLQPPVSEEMTRHYQVASLRGTHGFDVNGLIRCALQARHRREITHVQRRYGHACGQLHDFGRAAQAYLSSGDVDTAETFLQSGRGLEATERFDAFFPLPQIAAKADLVDHPRLWAAVLGARRLSVHPSILANEATTVLEGLDETSDPMLTETVRSQCAIAFLDAGQLDRAVAIVADRSDGASECNSLPLMAARATIDAYTGAFARSLATWHKIRPHALLNGGVLAELTRIEIRAARARGQWEIEYEAIERMLTAARESQAVTIEAVALAEAVFGSWLAAEPDLLEAYQTELRSLIQEHELPGLLNFNLATLGLPITSKDVSRYWDGIACLIASASAADSDVAAAFAKRAVTLADQASAALIRVLARVALAETAPAARESELAEAIRIAASMDSPALQASLLALSAKKTAVGMLEPFVDRLRSLAVASEEVVPTTDLHVRLGDAMVCRDHVPVNVAQGGWGLLATLALEGRAVHRDVLCDRLWPDMSLEAGYNALKMCVRRTRMQLGAPDAILSTQGGYALAPWVRVDLVEMEQLHAAITKNAVRDDLLPHIETYFANMREGRPATFAAWEWFDPVEQRLQSISRQFGQFLCERAIAGAHYPVAIEIAEYLVKLDPLDEAARRLLITALIGAGDRATAARELRYYERVLKEELDVDASADLRALLG